MHLVIEVDGTRREVELAQAAETATLADLVEHACNVPLPADVPLWVDDHRHEAGDLVRDVALIEGSRIGRSPAEQAVPVRGWAASLSAGLDAGWTVPVPTGRPLLIGRSPQADITLDSPSASWSHATVEHDGEGLRVRDAGSTNGTFVRGDEGRRGGRHRRGRRRDRLRRAPPSRSGGARTRPSPRPRERCTTSPTSRPCPSTGRRAPACRPSRPRSSRRPASPSPRPPGSPSRASPRRCSWPWSWWR